MVAQCYYWFCTKWGFGRWFLFSHNSFVISWILISFYVPERSMVQVFTFRTFCAIAADCRWLWDNRRPTEITFGFIKDFQLFFNIGPILKVFYALRRPGCILLILELLRVVTNCSRLCDNYRPIGDTFGQMWNLNIVCFLTNFDHFCVLKKLFSCSI